MGPEPEERSDSPQANTRLKRRWGFFSALWSLVALAFAAIKNLHTFDGWTGTHSFQGFSELVNQVSNNVVAVVWALGLVVVFVLVVSFDRVSCWWRRREDVLKADSLTAKTGMVRAEIDLKKAQKELAGEPEVSGSSNREAQVGGNANGELAPHEDCGCGGHAQLPQRIFDSVGIHGIFDLDQLDAGERYPCYRYIMWLQPRMLQVRAAELATCLHQFDVDCEEEDAQMILTYPGLIARRDLIPYLCRILLIPEDCLKGPGPAVYPAQYVQDRLERYEKLHPEPDRRP